MPFHSLLTASAAAALQYVNRGSVGAFCILLYDILLTFDDEVDLFWRKKWTFMKFNFFFVRYFPLLAQMPLLARAARLYRRDCKTWLIYQAVMLVLTIISCDLILRARIHTLYFDSKFVQRLVSFSLILEVVGVCVGLSLGILGIRTGVACIVTGIPREILYYAGAIIVFQTVLFGLTLYKFIAEVRAGWGSVPIVKLLMRDGTWAFFTLFAMVIGLSVYWINNPPFVGVLYPWVLTLYSFSGYRILFNINHLSRQPHDADVSGALVSKIEFKSQRAESPAEISPSPTQ